MAGKFLLVLRKGLLLPLNLFLTYVLVHSGHIALATLLFSEHSWLKCSWLFHVHGLSIVWTVSIWRPTWYLPLSSASVLYSSHFFFLFHLTLLIFSISRNFSLYILPQNYLHLFRNFDLFLWAALPLSTLNCQVSYCLSSITFATCAFLSNIILSEVLMTAYML